MGKRENLRPPWKKGESGNPKGRPKNRVVSEWLPECFGKTRARKIHGLTQEEVDAWEVKLMELGSPELAVIAKWDEAPVYAKNLAMALLFDTKNGRTTTIDKLRERQYGKPVQRIEVSTQDGTETPEEILAEVDRLMRVRREMQTDNNSL